nr:hypothetical protein [Tanacetum cinerariifolium]
MDVRVFQGMSDVDHTNEDGDIGMGDSTGVSASLDGEIFSRGKKFQESNIGNSDNTRDGGKIVGGAIGACGGIFLGQMTYLVASLTLDSANSCVMQGASCTQRKVSMVLFNTPFVLSWGGSISYDSLLPSILLLVVIIVMVLIVLVSLIVVIVAIAGVVIVVVDGVSFILKLSFVIIAKYHFGVLLHSPYAQVTENDLKRDVQQNVTFDILKSEFTKVPYGSAKTT